MSARGSSSSCSGSRTAAEVNGGGAPGGQSFRDATEPRFCPVHGRAALPDSPTADLGSPPPAARRGIERRAVGRGCSISRPRGPTPFTRSRNPKTKSRAAARKGSDSRLLYVCTRQRAALLRSRSSRRSLRGRVVRDGVGTRTSTWTAPLGEGFAPHCAQKTSATYATPK
jgi:hypothetical protein